MDPEQKFRNKHVHLLSSTEKKDLEVFLNERPINKENLASFCKRHVLPEHYRFLVWKVLLGITPRFAESHAYVRKQQELVYEELWKTLKALKLNVNINVNELSSGCFEIDETTFLQIPEVEHYLLMWLLSEAKLMHDPISQIVSSDYRRDCIVARQLSTLLDHPVDFFHFYTGLWKLLHKNKKEIIKCSDNAIISLKQKDPELHLYLLRVGLLSSTVLNDLCLSLFCEIFPDSVVVKILDKVIAGAFSFLTNVLCCLLNYLRSNLMNATSVESIRNTFLELRNEQADYIVCKALAQWKAYVEHTKNSKHSASV